MADVGSMANLAVTKEAAVATGGGAQGGVEKDGQEQRKTYTYPLIKVCDMIDELRLESVDMVVTAVEKHPGNYEAAAKNIKELMDKRCGNSWHVVVGEGFGFEMTHEMKNLLFMYFGSLGVLLWKAS